MNVITNGYGIILSHNNTKLTASSCLAQLEYWDNIADVKQTNISEKCGWQVRLINCAATSRWLVAHKDLGFTFEAEVIESNNNITFSIPHDCIRETKLNKIKSILPLPRLIGGHEKDGSTLVIPYEEGALCHCKNKETEEHSMPMYYPWPSYANMPLYGIDFGNNNAIAAIIQGGRFDCSLEIKTNWGKSKEYAIDALFVVRDHIDEDVNKETIEIHFFLLAGRDATYQGIAKCYRQYNRKLRKLPTLAEKIKENPTLKYAAQAISLRCRMGVKTMPTPVLEQTVETQPPIKVFMNFNDIDLLVTECAKQKIGPTEFNLVGWNYGGHDGAFPQLFPVEEALGGMKGLDHTIKSSHELGYPMSLHDNYFDAYTLANNFDKETINRNHDDTLTFGGQYGGGQAYQICAKCAYEKYAVNSLPEVVNLGVKGSYYSDVLTVSGLTKCYHSDHPMSRRDNAFWWKKILKMQHDLFASSYSEGARDWALPELDRAYLVSATDNTIYSFIDEKVPLFQIVYHGFLIYNSFRNGINTFMGEDLYLRNIAYGGNPIIYYHQIFNPEWNAGDGWDKDLTFKDADKLEKDVSRIKQMTDDVGRYSWLQTEFIEDYIKHSPTLTETVYSNGAKVIVNYSNDSYEMSSGERIPPKDFIVIN